MSDLYNENKDLKVQINSLQKQCQLYDQSEKSLRQSSSYTYETHLYTFP